jgi:hypothetical protein
LSNNIIEVVIDTHGTGEDLIHASGRVGSEFDKFRTDILNIGQRIVQQKAPRGESGELKASVKKDNTGIFVSKNIAPYRDFVIDGRRGFCRKGNTYMGKDIGNPRMLKFQYMGKTIFTRCVGPAKAQPFVDDAFPEVEQQINQRVRQFEQFLEAL